MAEALLIARLSINHAITNGEWEDAGETSIAALDLHTHATPAASAERIKIVSLLSQLGLSAQDRNSARETLIGLLRAKGLAGDHLTTGLKALQLLCEDDFDSFLESLEECCSGIASAALVEAPVLQALALATLGDVASALARVPIDDEAAEQAMEQLASVFRLLSALLYAPDVDLQKIAALSLGRLALAGSADDALEGHDDADAFFSVDLNSTTRQQTTMSSVELLHTAVDPESIIAELAFRYTAHDADANSNTLPKAAFAAHKAVVQMILACFEALVAAGRTAELSNTVVWILLGAAEDGALEVLRERSSSGGKTLLDARTLRCVRFLVSLVARPSAALDDQSEYGAAVHSIISATQVNMKQEHGLYLGAGLVALWLGRGHAHEE